MDDSDTWKQQQQLWHDEYRNVSERHGDSQGYRFPYTAHNKLFNKMEKVGMKGDLWEGQCSLADLINYCILKCLFTEVSSYKRSDVN